MDDLKGEYQRYLAGLPSHAATDPLPYEWWLEIKVIDLRGLRRFMTTAQIEYEFCLAPGSAKRAAQRGTIPAQKPGHDWLIVREDAMRVWGCRRRSDVTKG